VYQKMVFIMRMYRDAWSTKHKKTLCTFYKMIIVRGEGCLYFEKLDLREQMWLCSSWVGKV